MDPGGTNVVRWQSSNEASVWRKTRSHEIWVCRSNAAPSNFPGSRRAARFGRSMMPTHVGAEMLGNRPSESKVRGPCYHRTDGKEQRGSRRILAAEAQTSVAERFANRTPGTGDPPNPTTRVGKVGRRWLQNFDQPDSPEFAEKSLEPKQRRLPALGVGVANGNRCVAGLCFSGRAAEMKQMIAERPALRSGVRARIFLAIRASASL